MYIFDVETLGTDSNSVILSMACIYFNPEEKPTYKQLVDSALFVKFDAKDQIKRQKRTVNKGTLEWWDKQTESAKIKSFIPNKELDVTAEFGLAQLRVWAEQFPDHKKSTVWARGNMDQMVLCSLEHSIDVEDTFVYHRWRDVRTAVDLLTGSNNGYANIDHPEYNESQVVAHDPVHDCARDAMMLMYGKIGNT